MLEITGDHIAALNDVDLRSLIGLLCEAELRKKGLSVSGVTWGGNQTAPDGGLDVRVEIDTPLDINGFIPKSITGFQVKKPDMSASAIIKEMCPLLQNGIIRPIITDLANSNGAYIIVSSAGSTADKPLKERNQAMRDALANLSNADALATRFYDRGLIATWVRSHPSMILWVRSKLNNPISGWRAYENWSNTLNDINEPYLLDEKIRIHDNSQRIDGCSAIEGINKLRLELNRPRASIRLTGLSGVGKTRLVQALFDDRIGANCLNKSQVYYTDIGDRPVPDPCVFARNLLDLATPAFLVVDNCASELHSQLTKIITEKNSLISLITVEYDVREDQPEETSVYKLEPASEAIIKKVILNRYSHISEVDAHRIAEFSLGNARIAISLANTIQKGESVASLKDDTLFKRLFQQRHDDNEGLLEAAEVCSLVYSFDGESKAESNDELHLLASLVGVNVNKLHRHIAELKRRDLLQTRGIWRAVLPHAIANRLATRCLENIPINDLLQIFNERNPRLLTSFSRRLSYLHNDSVAQVIAAGWLTDGFLSDLQNIDSDGVGVFVNIAPILPEKTLQAFERAANTTNGEDFTSRNNPNFIELTRLLRLLAYDPELFDRAVDILSRFALSEKLNENNNSIRSELKSLFHVYLSGTHATVQQRVAVIQDLLSQDDVKKQEIGLSLLEASLQARHITGHYNYEFGVHTRDYGYQPKSESEFQAWFITFISFAEKIIQDKKPLASSIVKILEQHFRELWSDVKIYDALECIVNVVTENLIWTEGWIAIKTTIGYDHDRMSKQALMRLTALESRLKPQNLLDEINVFIFSEKNYSLNYVEQVEVEGFSKHDYTLLKAKQCGEQIAHDLTLLELILPRLMTSATVNSYLFCEGIALNCIDHMQVWNLLYQAMTGVSENDRLSNSCVSIFGGFLRGLSKVDFELSELLLSQVLVDTYLSKIFPMIQASVKITDEGADRLLYAINNNTAPIDFFKCLANGRAHESILDEKFCSIIQGVSSTPNGLSCALEILHMRVHGALIASDSIAQLGQKILANIDFKVLEDPHNHLDYPLGAIISKCCNGDSAFNATEKFCSNIIGKFSKHRRFLSGYCNTLSSLAKKQPIALLNGFAKFGRSDVNFSYYEGQKNPFSLIPMELVINWCESNPVLNYPVIASLISPYTEDEDKGIEWSVVARYVIENAPDKMEVLNRFGQVFMPTQWQGSRVELLRKRLPLLAFLKEHQDTDISGWALENEKNISRDIEFWKDREDLRSEEYQRFE